MRALARTAAVLLALAASAADASIGLLQLPPAGDDGPVTVFYPTAAPEQAVRRGPFTLQVAQNTPPVRGNGHLVMVSHGSGGNPWVHSNLARALVEAGFVVAMPEHHGDNANDPSHPGPVSWKQRPTEVSRAIDAVLRDPRFAPLLDPNHVGVYGMSAGGHTALSFAGGRWSPSQMVTHCEAHIAEDFPACVGLATRLRGDAFDGTRMKVALFVIRHRLDDPTWYTHDDPRVQAVVAGVPFAADFDPASLAQPRVPLGLVTADHDKWLAPRFHSGPILQACLPRCELVANIAGGGHGALLSPPPPPDVLGAAAADLLLDPPGFDRSVLPAVDQRIVAFFRTHLTP
jgi:predicted dienelactone hydrolase